jgi:hypothetical protein
MMQTITNGSDAISYEPSGGTIRLLAFVPAPGHDKPPYLGAGQVRPLWGGVVMLSAFSASEMSRGHMRLIVQLLREAGYTTLYAERIDNRTMPMATRIESGDFAGLWRLDLTAVPLRRRTDNLANGRESDE